jgi:predicted amidohydrolase
MTGSSKSVAKIKFSIASFDVGQKIKSSAHFRKRLIALVEKELRAGSRIVLLPEYLACALYQVPNFDLEQISLFIWEVIAHEMQGLSLKYNALILAGTSPFYSKGKLFNRALLWANGEEIFYAKNKLTPWEEQFESGRKVKVFEWQGLKVAPLICFDSEFPDISLKLKKAGVDLILCPSATSDLLGSERVHRCASARAVELGAAVLVSPLLGRDLKNPLVDINVGKLAVYYPSQEGFSSSSRHRSAFYKSGDKILKGDIDVAAIRRIKIRDKKSFETKPFLVS